MSKKHVVFIVLLTVAAMLVWILGEILIIAVLKLGGKASIIWSIIMILVIIAISGGVLKTKAEKTAENGK